MTAIQRFALHGTIMNPHSSGPYVRHEDHLAAMQGRCLAQIEEPAGAALAAVAPFGYVNIHTGQFFTDVEPCRQGNEGHWRTVYLQPAAAAPEHSPIPEHWSVVVNANGEDILCIGSSGYSGREPSDADEQAIIGAAQHLLAFVGYGLPPCDFDPDDEPAPAPALEAPTPVQIQALHRARRAAQAQQKGPA